MKENSFTVRKMTVEEFFCMAGEMCYKTYL